MSAVPSKSRPDDIRKIAESIINQPVRRESISNEPIIQELFSFSLEEEDEEEEEKPRREPIQSEYLSHSMNEEDSAGRSDWFFSQRAYPHDDVPTDSRRLAWETVRLQRNESDSLRTAATAWQAIGPNPTHSAYISNWGQTSGRINSVAISPANSRIVLIGASTGGIWRSTNSGSSFIPVSDNHVDLAVGWITFSKSSPTTVYAGMGDTKAGYLGSGVLKSTDEGRTWHRVNNNSLPSPGTIARIEVDPTNPNRVYVAQFSRIEQNKRAESGAYLSTDGGVSWSRTFTGWVRDIVIDPTDRQILYLGVGNRRPDDGTQPEGLYRSTDSGKTWNRIMVAPFDDKWTWDMRVAVTATSPKKIYVYMGGFVGPNFSVRLMSSDNNGQSWTDRSLRGVDIGAFGYNTYLHVDQSNGDRVYIGSRDVFRSTDGGDNWKNLNRNYTDFGHITQYTPALSNTHPDQHGFAISPDNPGEIYLGNDGGLSKSTDGGETFQSINQTLSLTQFIGITMHPTDPTISYGGSQDNGTQRRFNGSSLWVEFADGDGGRCVLNRTFPGIIVINYIQGALFRYYENGTFFDRQLTFNSTFGEFPGPARIGFYPPFTGNEADDTLYFGTWRLFTSTDIGSSWKAPGGTTDLTKGITDKGADVLSAIGVSKSNTNIIYTGSAQGRAMTSTDAGLTWSDASEGLPDRFITSIVINPENSALAYLAVSGFGTGHVFKTSDGGATWTEASAGLPDIPANALLIDPNDSNRIYVGTDIGVFRTTNGATNWQSFNQGMPPVVVTGLASQPSGLIQASTYGRGAYEFNSVIERPAIASVVFNGKKLLTITGSSFSSSPKVIINGVDRSNKAKKPTDTLIKVKGKVNQLGLVTGDNTIQVINAEGTASAVFILKL
jgi:photosystem II stability/assembly factor-like uncharacterized protein